MRIVFVGAGGVAVAAAKDLINQGHDIIMIEQNKARIDAISEYLDCGFLLGDGANPEILGEANPEYTDFLFCLTNSDQVNMLTALIAGTLGFKTIITSIVDSQYESICKSLGIKNIIIPVRAISRHLQGIVNGDPDELANLL